MIIGLLIAAALILLGVLYIKAYFEQIENDDYPNNNYYKKSNNKGYWYNGKYYNNNYNYRKQSEASNGDMPTELPYVKREILTNAEHGFYVLLKAVCDRMKLIVCPKVRMEDFLKVTDEVHKKKYRGYIKSRHIDFIICDKDMKMIAGVELDDNSHNTPEAQKVDDFKNRVFKKINVPLFRVKVSYDRTQYKAPIINILRELGCIKSTSQNNKQNTA